MKKILVILGPTATGKSDLAVDMAKKFNGEIISADSRQVYKGMDIGSGKITKKEMMGIPHHLLDVIDPKNTRYTVEDFRREGNAVIKDIISRGKLPIICGGTGFYIDALVYNQQFPDVPPNQTLRKKLEKKSLESLMKELKKLDPVRAKNIDPFNKVRIIRAIEIARTLGKVPKLKKTKQFNTLFIGLTLPKEKLRERIHTRLIKRMDIGMPREIAKLHKKGVSWKCLYAFGLEYRYLSLYLQKKLSKEETLDKLEWQIFHFSKRQMIWFQKNKNIKWFKPGDNLKIAQEIKIFIK